jgi:hypothetical protein
VNLVGLLLQLFLTSRVIRWIGIRGSLFVLPLIALVNYSMIALVPLLAVVRIGKVLENSTARGRHSRVRSEQTKATLLDRRTSPRHMRT